MTESVTLGNAIANVDVVPTPEDHSVDVANYDGAPVCQATTGRILSVDAEPSVCRDCGLRWPIATERMHDEAITYLPSRLSPQLLLTACLRLSPENAQVSDRYVVEAEECILVRVGPDGRWA
jgi:hypothetical protein